MVPSISSAENSFSSVETTFYLFFKYYPVENRLEQIHELRGTINDENLLLMIPELHTSVASYFPIKVITNMAFFQFCIYFGILVLLNQKKVIPLSYHVQATFINKKDTCSAKLHEIHSTTQRKIFRVWVFKSKQ